MLLLQLSTLDYFFGMLQVFVRNLLTYNRLTGLQHCNIYNNDAAKSDILHPATPCIPSLKGRDAVLGCMSHTVRKHGILWGFIYSLRRPVSCYFDTCLCYILIDV